MRKLIVVALVLLSVIGGLVYHYAYKEYEFRFSESQLQEKINAKMPLSKTYLGLFKVTLVDPRVYLANGSDKVGVGLDVILDMSAGGTQKPLSRGTLDVTGGIKYEAKKGAFFLTEPVIENLAVQGLSDKYSEIVNAFITKKLTEYYAEHPVYVLKSTDKKQIYARRVLKNVRVENKTLIVTLGIRGK